MILQMSLYEHQISMQTHKRIGRINEKFSSDHPAMADELAEQGYIKETTYEAVKGILAINVEFK